MEILKTWSPIETYTALYIRAVRTRGYNKSLYSFVGIFKESATIKLYANRIIQGFMKTGLIVRKDRQTYEWNRSGKYILMDGIHAFVQDCLYTGFNASKMEYIYTNKQMQYETRTICKWKV